MNRMIRLFQQKADQAFSAYIKNRNGALGSAKIDSPEWQAAVARGIELKTKADAWQRAADLLRKEEISNPKVSS